MWATRLLRENNTEVAAHSYRPSFLQTKTYPGSFFFLSPLFEIGPIEQSEKHHRTATLIPRKNSSSVFVEHGKCHPRPRTLADTAGLLTRHHYARKYFHGRFQPFFSFYIFRGTRVLECFQNVLCQRASACVESSFSDATPFRTTWSKRHLQLLSPLLYILNAA